MRSRPHADAGRRGTAQRPCRRTGAGSARRLPTHRIRQVGERQLRLDQQVQHALPASRPWMCATTSSMCSPSQPKKGTSGPRCRPQAGAAAIGGTSRPAPRLARARSPSKGAGRAGGARLAQPVTGGEVLEVLPAVACRERWWMVQACQANGAATNAIQISVTPSATVPARAGSRHGRRPTARRRPGPAAAAGRAASSGWTGRARAPGSTTAAARLPAGATRSRRGNSSRPASSSATITATGPQNPASIANRRGRSVTNRRAHPLDAKRSVPTTSTGSSASSRNKGNSMNGSPLIRLKP